MDGWLDGQRKKIDEKKYMIVWIEKIDGWLDVL